MPEEIKQEGVLGFSSGSQSETLTSGARDAKSTDPPRETTKPVEKPAIAETDTAELSANATTDIPYNPETSRPPRPFRNRKTVG